MKECLVFGLAEQIGGDVFNCAVFIDRDGEIGGKHHKMQLAEGYLILRGGTTVLVTPPPLPSTRVSRPLYFRELIKVHGGSPVDSRNSVHTSGLVFRNRSR